MAHEQIEIIFHKILLTKEDLFPKGKFKPNRQGCKELSSRSSRHFSELELNLDHLSKTA